MDGRASHAASIRSGVVFDLARSGAGVLAYNANVGQLSTRAVPKRGGISPAGDGRRECALVPAVVQTRPPALYRIPITLTLLGLFLIAIQAGQPLLGLAAMMTALLSTAAFTWRSMARRYAPAMILRDQGDAKLVSGRYAEARALYERALAIVQRELPPAAPEVLLNYYSLAAVNSMLHEHGRADQYLDKLLQGLNHRVPAPWAGHVAWLLRRVAHHHSMEGRHQHAVDLCERALDLVGEAPGADDNTVRSLLDDLAWIHHHAGDYAKAQAYFREALAIHEQFRDVALELAHRPANTAHGSESPYRAPSPATASTTGGLDRAVAYSLLGLGWTVYERGGYEEARSLLQRAAMMAVNAPLARVRESEDTPEGMRNTSALAVEILRGQAAVEMTLGNYDAAAQLYDRAKVLVIPGGEGIVQSAALAIDLGWLARCRERFDDAERVYAEVSQALARSGDGVAAIACALHESMAELRRRQGRFKAAHREIQRAAALADRCLGLEHPRRAAILAIASRIHTARSEFSQSERCARKCLQVLRAALGHNHPRLADGYVALELRESMLGSDHPELVEVLEGRVAVLRATSRDKEATEAVARVEAIREKMTA
jgi:tetratricopeptide (TPR) repeat protein